MQASQLPPFQPKRAAIILPLTGRLQTQGQSIKDGLTAAYYSQQHLYPYALHLDFIDSNLGLPTNLTQYDLVLGPLLKENIAKVADRISNNALWLTLNRPQQQLHRVKNNSFSFALSPEDEAKQLADYLYQQNHRYPIITHAQQRLFQRMATAFNERWQALTGSNIQSVRFANNKQMKERMSQALGVSEANGRIKLVESVLKEELHAVPRSRQDVDAIVLFAPSEQSELLNPIIKASVSPFSKQYAKVYASSYSFRQKLGKNSLRDLRNLTFTEMPWLLPNHSWQSLSQLKTQFWSEQSESSQRFFAMGYDSFRLFPYLRYMQLLPQNHMQGLTGKLSVNSEGNVIRQLSVATYEQQGIRSVEEN
jgi:outer membrane PBP1 activator LpoA protein